jgi:outer membrane protein TolC
VNFSYGKQTSQGTGQGDYVAQLTLNVPIFSGGSTYGAVGSAQSELLAVEQSVIESRLTIRERLLSAWSDYYVAQERVNVGKSQVNTARQVVKGYDQQFRIGRRSLFDLLSVQNELYGYQSNLTMAVFDVKINHARILASMGQLALAYQKLGYQKEPKLQSPSQRVSDIK